MYYYILYIINRRYVIKKYRLRDTTQYEDELCMLFAKACVDTNIDEYSRRNQENVHKIIYDIYNGKRAEIMVYHLFKKRKQQPNPIDFMIYDAKEKSFDADMLTRKHNVHIKSCKDDTPFPNSWLFQPWDTLVNYPTNNDIIVLVVLKKHNSYCYIIHAIDAKYDEPILKSLNKKVIYEENL